MYVTATVTQYKRTLHYDFLNQFLDTIRGKSILFIDFLLIAIIKIHCASVRSKPNEFPFEQSKRLWQFVLQLKLTAF